MHTIGFGALNLDKLCKVKQLARKGEHQEIIEFVELPGGSAANTITGLSRLGVETGFIGAIGEDPEGKILIDDFRNNRVDTQGISTIKGRTGLIIGFVDSKGERTLYPYPGVNSRLEFMEEHLEYVRNAKYLHLSSFVDNLQLKAQKKLVHLLPKEIKLTFSPGILYSRKGLHQLLPIIKRCSVIFINEQEIKEITGEDYEAGSKILNEKGAETVAVTLGEKGCYIRDAEDDYRIKAEPVDVKDTTGAGDAFCAGFLYGLSSGKDIQEAGRLGNLTAAFCIQKLGARTGLPTLDMIKE